MQPFFSFFLPVGIENVTNNKSDQRTVYEEKMKRGMKARETEL